MKDLRLTVQGLCQRVQADQDFRFRLIGGVVVCDPPTYPSKEEVQQLKAQGYSTAIGLHPKNANSYSEEDYVAFQNRLAYPEVNILGEVGLDYTADASTWDQQHVALDRVLQELQPSHVLVLHARGTYYQLLFQLKGVVPSEQHIHLHCFEGSRRLVQDWLKEFPNTRFGFTALVKHFNATSKWGLRSIPEEKLLLGFPLLPHWQQDRFFACAAGNGGQSSVRHPGTALEGGVGDRLAQCKSSLRRMRRRTRNSQLGWELGAVKMIDKMVADIQGQDLMGVLGVGSCNASILYQLSRRQLLAECGTQYW